MNVDTDGDTVPVAVAVVEEETGDFDMMGVSAAVEDVLLVLNVFPSSAVKFDLGTADVGRTIKEGPGCDCTPTTALDISDTSFQTSDTLTIHGDTFNSANRLELLNQESSVPMVCCEKFDRGAVQATGTDPSRLLLCLKYRIYTAIH